MGTYTPCSPQRPSVVQTLRDTHIHPHTAKESHHKTADEGTDIDGITHLSCLFGDIALLTVELIQ